MRRILIVVPVLVVWMLAGGTASADKPDREVIRVDDTFETEECGFLVSVHATGTIIRNTWTYEDGSVRIHESYPKYRWTLTNVGTGETLEVGAPGPALIEVAPDGSSTLTGTGPWILIIPQPELGGPGIFLLRGRFVLNLDADGNLISFTRVGTIEDLCEELAS